jgi:hypothetical protein
MLTTAIGATSVVCAADEFLQFQPTNSQTCQQYLEPYMAVAGGYLKDPSATDICNFCSISSTNVFLEGVSYSYENRWVSLSPATLPAHLLHTSAEHPHRLVERLRYHVGLHRFQHRRSSRSLRAFLFLLAFDHWTDILTIRPPLSLCLQYLARVPKKSKHDKKTKKDALAAAKSQQGVDEKAAAEKQT